MDLDITAASPRQTDKDKKKKKKKLLTAGTRFHQVNRTRPSNSQEPIHSSEVHSKDTGFF